MAVGKEDLGWASGAAGEALDALGGVDQFRDALGFPGDEVREAVLAAGGAGLVTEALASIAEALDTDTARVAVHEALSAAGGAPLVAEALAAACALDGVAEALVPAGGFEAVREAVMIASRLEPT